jgi:transposase
MVIKLVLLLTQFSKKTTTPLSFWLYAMTRSGVAAKALQRELGVTYKTAWRMMKQIRILKANTDTSLMSVTVEVDEAYFGGNGHFRHK